MLERIKFCIIGVSDHQGVMEVGGRLGASLGPKAFRSVFRSLRGRLPIQLGTEDLGDVPGLGSDVARNHELASQFIAQAHEEYSCSVVVGGGHDHGFSHLQGVFNALSKKRGPKKWTLGCINLDAHLDVRKPAPRITSGSPFYLALESGILKPKHFIEFGIQSHCNAPELWEYVQARGVSVVPFQKLRGGRAVPQFKKKFAYLQAHCDFIVVSLDLDSLSQAYAPGVSAPQAEGFTSSEIIEMMEFAGAQKEACSLGVFELNPLHDSGEKTARLAATAAYHFLESAAQRSS
ncbi:MAG: formimidoylglutamase [Bdellovibrionia bacterium]